MILCIVPADCPGEELMRLHALYRDNPNVQVIVDRRRADLPVPAGTDRRRARPARGVFLTAASGRAESAHAA